MTIDLEQMMRDQAAIQRLIGGTPPSSRTAEEQMEFLREMSTAVTSELHEALNETGWKTWASSNHINRAAYLGELTDLLQFWMNMVALVDGSAEEICDILARKHVVNRLRVKNGYTGLEKDSAGRALDDPHSGAA